jgi:hypothetical protein
MKEVEISQNWEKLHKELSTKYYELEKKYNLLKIDHDKLKKEVMDGKGLLNKFKANATLILADKIVVNEFKTYLKNGSFLWILK